MSMTRERARAVPSPTAGCYLDGAWLERSTGGERTHLDPATADVVGNHQLAGEAEVDSAVAAARAALGELG